jgi:hypothetical protein
VRTALGIACLAGCGFRASPLPAVEIDAAVDAPPIVVDTGPDAAPARLCSTTAALVCFSFDAPTTQALPAIANEGTAAITLQATGVTPLDDGLRLDTSSQIRIAPNAVTQNIASAEAWVRIDADPPAGGRVGIMDADATSSALSFFYYLGAAHQLRFEIGQNLYLDHTVPLGSSIYLAQVCDANVLTAYVDGKPIGSRDGCTPGNATTYGLQLGQNNTQTAGDEGMTGALDGVRLWTTPLTAAEICATARRPDCEPAVRTGRAAAASVRPRR